MTIASHRRTVASLITGPAALPVCGAVTEACFLGLALAGDLRPQIGVLWGLMLPAFACYGVACYRATRRQAGGALPQILAFAFLFRLTLLWATPNLSDDIYRYVWDGRVQLAGINPYQHAPDAPALADVRDDLYPSINHKEIRTVYPPVAQAFFAAVCLIEADLLVMKVALVACEAAMLLALLKLLALRGLPRERLLLYAWNPLAVIEIAGSGHIDSLAVSLMMWALYLLLSGGKRASAAVLGAAVLSKLVPLLALPVLWRHMARNTATWRSTWLAPGGRIAMLWFALVVAAGYAAYAGAGASNIADGLRVYLMKWRFNDGAFTLVYELLREPGTPWDDAALERARLLCALALAAVSVGALIRIGDPLRAAFIPLAAHLLLSPTVHPWYLLWILPFLPFFPSPAWLYLSGASLLAYDVLDGFHATGVWHEAAWVKWVEYGPFVALLALPRFARRARP